MKAKERPRDLSRALDLGVSQNRGVPFFGGVPIIRHSIFGLILGFSYFGILPFVSHLVRVTPGRRHMERATLQEYRGHPAVAAEAVSDVCGACRGSAEYAGLDSGVCNLDPKP